MQKFISLSVTLPDQWLMPCIVKQETQATNGVNKTASGFTLWTCVQLQDLVLSWSTELRVSEQGGCIATVFWEWSLADPGWHRAWQLFGRMLVGPGQGMPETDSWFAPRAARLGHMS